MNLVEKGLRVPTDSGNFGQGSKFRIVHDDDTISYYIMCKPGQNPWRLVNMLTGGVLKFQKGTMFTSDVEEELNRLTSNEKLDSDVSHIKSWAYIPEDRFSLEVDLKGLVL